MTAATLDEIKNIFDNKNNPSALGGETYKYESISGGTRKYKRKSVRNHKCGYNSKTAKKIKSNWRKLYKRKSKRRYK